MSNKNKNKIRHYTNTIFYWHYVILYITNYCKYFNE